MTRGAVACFAGAAACLVAWDAVPAWTLIAVLVALLAVAGVAQRRVNRDTGSRWRIAGPLLLFALAFVVILAPRAITLAAGGEGRYFAVHGAWGETVSGVRPAKATQRPGRNRLRNPSVEANAFYWAPLGSDGAEFSAAVERTTTDASAGRAAARFTYRVDGPATYVTFELGTQPPARVPVRPGRLVLASADVRAAAAAGRFELLVAYYDARGRFLADGRVGDPVPAGGARWRTLGGTDRVPAGAATAGLELLHRGLRAGVAHELLADAAVLVVDVPSPAAVVPFARATPDDARWADAFRHALGLSTALLAVVVGGFLLPAGGWLGARAPRLAVEAARPRVLWGVLAVSVVAYAVEMATYGGYGGYLDRLDDVTTGMRGKWYLHALALLASGSAVAVVGTRVVQRRRLTLSEVAVTVVGVAIALSYFLKAAVAIPMLCVLLFLGARGRRVLPALALGAAAFAILSPFVNLVRGSGRVGPGDLLTGAYWGDFATALESRFFHLESLMVATAAPGELGPARPVVDLVTSVVPRVLWAGKPDSAAAEFTAEYLQSGLHGATDVGVLSLPGEAFLVAGVVGIVAFGLVLGVALRAVHGLLHDPALPEGTVLLGCGVLTLLVFLNDGWGLASSLQVVLIASAGWLVLLRRASG